MANNYVQFSECMFEQLTPEECEWLETALGFGEAVEAVEFLGQAIDNEDWPAFSWEIKVEKGAGSLFWVYADEYGSVENIATLCQAFIKKFRPESVVGLSWAAFCSKLRIGEFSGGWFVVSKDEQRWGEACERMERDTREMIDVQASSIILDLPVDIITMSHSMTENDIQTLAKKLNRP